MKKITTFCFTLFCFVAFSQTPQKINYQGVARDNIGNVIPNQSVGLRITLHSGTLTGTSVYQETHSVTTNTFGLFTLEIGNGSIVSGNFGNINWGINTYYVQVEMDPAGGSSYSDMGTSQLISVPYALYANKAAYAENAVTYTAGTGISINGSNVITNTSPDTDDQNLSVSGNTLSISGGNSVNIPGYWTANGNHIYNNNSANVGIGTTAPTNPLVIQRSANSGEGRNLVLVSNPSTGDHSVAGIKIEAGSPQTNDAFMVLQFHSETYTATDNYADFGQVWSNGNGLILRAADINSSNHPMIKFQTGIEPPQNGSYDRMIIDEDGYIGIGTNTPHSKLQLTGGDFYIENNTNGVIMKSPNGQCWKMTVDNSGQITTTSITCP